ncbi:MULTISPECIES: class I SAM-dependent methyltransferase [Pseudomonas]|uniref:class I SAM-dependent methyltransferase n=1 Tax=Pseudomonas TaxID=286 RepID=UPI0011B8087B|nr:MULTISPECIES: class I SAM-dependent methyltransferase [Pseudomonas]MDW3713297.1 SAM-dependent methyltransferase [Pseudomonas sp. 2023EL-01195]
MAGRLTAWREERLVRRALSDAGEPNLVLNLSSRSGHLWQVLTRHPNRIVIVGDDLAGASAQSRTTRNPGVAGQVAVQYPPLHIDLGENAVDSIFCLRVLQRIENPQSRLQVLRELHRVTRDTLIISLWIDGNYQAWRRKRLESQRTLERGQSARIVVPRRQIEEEFQDVGFTVLSHMDLLPGYSMWRFYILRKTS